MFYRSLLQALSCWLILPAAVEAANVKLEIDTEPVNRAVKNNIEAYLDSLEAANQAELQRQLRHVEQQVSQAVQALGYYHARSEMRIAGRDEKPVLKLQVQLGPPIRLDTVRLTLQGAGEGTPAFEPITRRLKKSEQLATGEILNHGHYDNLKALINRQALRYGFFDGRFVESQLRIDVQTNLADILLTYDTGSRYRLGEVQFSEIPLSHELLQRMVPFAPGTPYDSELLVAFNRDLLSSGYFNSVQVNALPETAADDKAWGERVIPVEVALSERDPHSLGLGGGYSTDVGVRGKFTWTQHWLNALGHSRGAAMELSSLNQELTSFYEIPLDPPLTHHLRYFAGLQHQDIDNIETESVSVGAELQKRLQNNWERTLGLRLQHELFSLGEASGESTLVIPSLVLQKTQVYSLERRNRVVPQQGYSLMMNLQGAKQGLISTVDFARVMGQVKGLYTLAGRHRLLGRVSIGGIATDGFEDIPPSLRFFAGGDQSVRGYGYQDLSPVDRNGEKIGGRYLLTSSVEYQYEFIENWRLAGFVDHGNAVDSLEAPLKTSVGLGVHWVSPIGPIRIDVAKSLSDPDEGFRIHFTMGPEL